jgi:uncharacterized ion transporter superfamily protein YfcC
MKADAPTPSAPAKRRSVAFPTAYAILFALIALFAALSWIVPAGQYDRAHDVALDRDVAVRGSYHAVAANPQTPLDVIMAPVRGFYDPQTEKTRAVDVVLFVLFLGGFMGVVGATKAIDVGIVAVTRAMAGRELWMIPVLMGLFAVCGSTFGMEEEALPLLAVLVPVMMRAGFDSLTATAVVGLGTGAGRFGAMLNPFSVGIASNAAGTAYTEGIALRAVLLVAGWAICAAWVMRYAMRVKKDPSRSLVADLRAEIETAFHTGAPVAGALTPRQGVVLAIFVLTFTAMIVGVTLLGWWMGEMTALFLGASIVAAIAAGMGEGRLVEHFVDGARGLLGVALIIGLARGVLVVMDEGRITDTILHGGETMLAGLSPIAFINGVLLVEALMAVLVPSSSGEAVLTMPVLAPLADFAGVDRHFVVTAYLAGMNAITFVAPTQAAMMGMLAIGRIPLDRWFRFAAPLTVMLMAVAGLALSIGVALG